MIGLLRALATAAEALGVLRRRPVPGEGGEENTYGLPDGQPIADDLVKHWKEQEQAILDSLPDDSEDLPTSLPVPASAQTKAMAESTTPLLAEYWNAAGKKTFIRLGLDPDGWTVTNPFLRHKIEHAAFAFCDSTNKTTAKKIERARAMLAESLAEGLVEKGEALPKLRKRVQVIFEGMARWKAQQIAATEASRAVHAAQVEADIQSDVVAGVELLLSGDACPLCRKVATEAKQVRLGHAFAVIGSNPDYSTIRHPPIHPHCQCALIEVLKPEYGGPKEPQWAETLQQPQKGLEGEEYTPPPGQQVPQPEPEKLEPKKPPETTPPKEAPERKDLETPPRPEKFELPPNIPLPPPPPPPAPAPEAKPKAPRRPRKPRQPKEVFPADPDAMERVRALGGSTGAELVRDPATGKQYVRKRGNSPEHLREECTADGLYQQLGVRVPAFKLYETPAGPVKLAQYLEGAKTLADVEQNDPALYKKAVKDLRKDFAADAWLANWDVIGLNSDNILVDADGKAWRVDNGGSLRFRAQGTRKNADEWNVYPVEAWTMRDPRVGPARAKVFGGLKMEEIAQQIGAMEGRTVKVPADLAAVLKGRMEQLKDIRGVANTLTADGFLGGYADEFCKHKIGIRKAGLADRMPKQLNQTCQGCVEVADENGKPWDHLRGRDSLVEDLEKYVNQQGTYKTISKWMSGQAGNSWSAQPMALKAFLAEQRTAARNEYFWHEDYKKCRAELTKLEGLAGTPANYKAAVAAMHAFTHEYLTRIEFTNKNADGTVRLMRTEPKAALAAAGIQKGAKGAKMKRGLAESTSIYQPVTVHGSEITYQDVPLHRVLATYWQERRPYHGEGAFLSDRENEFVAILHDVPFSYGKPGP